LAELVGVTAGDFVAVLFDFEGGAGGVAILLGEGPFPGAGGVRIAAKSGERRQGEGG